MNGDTTNGCEQDTLFFRIRADVELETRATGEVQKKITPSPVARESPSTLDPCLLGNHEKIAPVLQTTHETTTCFPAFSIVGDKRSPQSRISRLLLRMRRMYVASIRLDLTQFDHARLDLLPLVF